MRRSCPRCSTDSFDIARYCSACGEPLAAPAAPATDAWIGRTLAERYRLVGVLGQGGMGTVYLAEQRMGAIARRVAVKTLRGAPAADAELRARFERECETVVQLSHPNTIQFYDFGALDDGTLFIVMEYVEGSSLAQAIAGGPMDLARVERLLVQICGSLQEAHERGIVHRDVKPENVLLTTRGGQREFAKLLDFGIAKHTTRDEASPVRLTREGIVLGTPPYMSPEQFTGQPLDGRSDVYSLGLIAYEMLTGQRPFQAGEPWEWATAHLTRAPRPFEEHPSTVDLAPAVKVAVLRALAKDRALRPPTAAAFLEAFIGHGDLGRAWIASTLTANHRAVEVPSRDSVVETLGLAVARGSTVPVPELATHPPGGALQCASPSTPSQSPVAPTLRAPQADSSGPVPAVQSAPRSRRSAWVPLVAVAAALLGVASWQPQRAQGPRLPRAAATTPAPSQPPATPVTAREQPPESYPEPVVPPSPMLTTPTDQRTPPIAASARARGAPGRRQQSVARGHASARPPDALGEQDSAPEFDPASDREALREYEAARDDDAEPTHPGWGYAPGRYGRRWGG